MKYSYRFIFVLFCFFIFRSEVDAAIIGYKNICDSNSTSPSSILGSCSGNALRFDIKDEDGEPEEDTDIKTVEIPDTRGFQVLFLVDNSDSMDSEGYGGGGIKYEKANEMIKKIIEKIKVRDKKNDVTSVYNYCLFDAENLNHSEDESPSMCVKNWKGKGDILNKENTRGKTKIQSNLKKAYNFFNSNKKENLKPLLILITDGLANFSQTLYDVNIGYSSSDFSYLGYSASVKHSYYTVRTLRSLKENMPELSILTFGIGMREDDYLSKYTLNPTVANYNSLPSSRSTEADRMYTWMAGSTTDIVDHEFVAFFDNGGLFKGTLKKADNKLKKVEFDIDVNIANDSYFKERWGAKNFVFSFPVSKATKSITMEDSDVAKVRITIKNANGNNVVYQLTSVSTSGWSHERNIDNGSAGKRIDFAQFVLAPNVKGKKVTKDANGKTVYANKVSEINLREKHLVKVVVWFKNEIDGIDIDNVWRSYTLSGGIPNYSDFSKVNGKDIVDFSYVGTAKNLGDFIDNEVNFDTFTVTETVTIKGEYPVKKHTPCSSTTISLNNIYTNVGTRVYDENGLLVNSGIGKVTLKIPILLVESSELRFNRPSSPIYAGGGFSWSGSTVKTSIQWYYQNLDKDKNVIFDVEPRYGLTSQKLEEKVFKRSIKDITLCANSTCTEIIDNNWLDAKIWEVLKTNYIKSNVDFSGAFSSIDSNKVETGKVNMPVNTKLVSSPSGTIYNGNSTLSSKEAVYEHRVTLKNYYINEARVYYNDTIPAGMENTGSNMYYVPLKMPSGTVNVDVNFNFSLIDAILLKFQDSCPVNVKQLFYGDGGFSYNYRSIDVENPFPKNVIPDNWKNWYVNTSNKQRLANSYSNYPNNALYAITFDSNKKRTMLSNNSVYTDWTGITNNGVSTFVQTYFDKLPTNDSYCKKGKWNSACDIRR